MTMHMAGTISTATEGYQAQPANEGEGDKVTNVEHQSRSSAGHTFRNSK